MIDKNETTLEHLEEHQTKSLDCGGEQYTGMVSYGYLAKPSDVVDSPGTGIEGLSWVTEGDTNCNDKNGKPPLDKHCILVTKVFDFCFKRIIQEECFNFPEADIGDTFRCKIVGGLGGITCRVAARERIDESNFFRVTLVKQFTLRITLNGQTREFDVVKTETIRLFNPNGTTIQCEITSARCEPMTVTAEGVVCVIIKICQLLEVKAPVKLEVEARPCIPDPCPQEQPEQPGFICPPQPIPQQDDDDNNDNDDNNDDNDDDDNDNNDD